MTDAPAKRSQAPGGHVRALLRWVWAEVLTNRGLVVSMITLGIVEAALTKAPIALLSPITEALVPAAPPGSPLAESTSWFNAWFERLAVSLREHLGVTFDGTTAQVRAMTLCFASALIAALLGILASFAIYGTLVLTRYFAFKIVVDLRNTVAAHVMRLPLRFFGARRMGDLISNITNDTTVLSRSFSLACDHVVVDPLLVLANFALIVMTVPEAAWVLALMIPIMALPLVRMGRRVHRTSKKSLAAMGDATESMNQMLSGIRTVKAFQLERQRLAEFEDSNALYLRRTKRMLQVKALSEALVSTAYQIGFAVMLAGAGWLVVSGKHHLSGLAVALPALATTYTHVKRLSRAYNTVLESAGAMARIQELLDERPDAGVASGGRVIERPRGDVVFDAVSFRYDREQVLHEVSFRVRSGEAVALVGPSGAGKTTALDLLARFHDPTSGRILIDGHDLRDLDIGSYRRHVAIVSQQPFLFNATILENIRCGRPDATEAEVVAAAQAAQIHDFVLSLPQGYQTMAGERGCNLSGGQMQRITIARAILRDPAVLILDEATSALDSESEELVQRALQRLMVGRTSFVIAHRLSTIASADQILVLEGGRLVEQGTHAELIDRDGLYSRLRQLQYLG